MGMFDYIRYKNEVYQTKDTDRQFLDSYKIETDQESGHDYLWLEDYDADWVSEPDELFGGYLKRSNVRWVRQDNFDGLLHIYRNLDDTYKVWEEYDLLFMDGKVIKTVKKERNDG